MKFLYLFVVKSCSIAAIPHVTAILRRFQQEIRFRHLFTNAYEGNSTTAITGLQFTNTDSTRVNSLLRIARNLFRACWNFWVSHEYFELFVNACDYRGMLENLSSLIVYVFGSIRFCGGFATVSKTIVHDCRFSFFFVASRRSFDVDEFPLFRKYPI